jgi:methionyl-tRNA formyltransferase
MRNKKNRENKKYIFIGGKQIGVNCLKELVDRNIKPQLVIPNSDDNGQFSWHDSLLEYAIKRKLPVIQGAKLKNQDLIKKIKEISPEIIFCIGGTQIIPESILAIPQLGCLNIHPAYLPKYRGRYSTAHAIFNGEKKTGVTLHWMNNGIDSGPIIKQKKILITNIDTALTLYNKFTETGTELFSDFLDKWLSGAKITAKAQNEKKATYYLKGLPNDGKIDWNWNGKKIYNFIRAMTFEPFSPAYFTIGDKKMVIIDEKYFKE